MEWSIAAIGAVDGGVKTIRGIASTYNNVDRNRRKFEAGAFAKEAKTVPLLAYHDDERPIGTAQLTPTSKGLEYVAKFADDDPTADQIRNLVKAKAIAAVSIGWVDRVPAQVQGDPWDSSSFRVHSDAEVVELSVVPIPANPAVTMEVASLFGRRMSFADVMDLLTAGPEMASEVAATLTRSQKSHAQQIHDHSAALGAVCANNSDEQESALSAVLMARLRMLGLEAALAAD